LYFLSILCNGLAGYVLFAGKDSESNGKGGFSVKNPIFYLVLGIISAVIGILKLLSPLHKLDFSEGIIILGDLLPAAGGIIAGLMLIFGIYKDASFKVEKLENIGLSLLAFRRPIGIGLIVIAFVHFLFGQLLFL
jgi:hypothetical protein